MRVSCLCVISRRGIGTSSLMRFHHFLLLLIQSLEGLDTVMPFGVTVAGNVFQHKLDQCFGHIKQVIVIAFNIMIAGKKPNHRNHAQAIATLLETARRCNMQLNYEKLHCKKEEVAFMVKRTLQIVTSQIRIKLQQSSRCVH